MSPTDPSAFAAATDPADDALARALRAWAAPTLPDDGFTEAVLQRVAQDRAAPGLAPAEALQRLHLRQRRQARRLRRSGWGLGLGLAVALAWLLAWMLAGGDGSALAAGGAAPWWLWLGMALTGSAGATAWLAQQGD